MADFVSPQLAGQLLNPPAQLDGALINAKLRVARSLINLANPLITTADNVLLAKLPPGARFMAGILTASVSLGTSVVAIGTNKVHINNGQYRAAATFTAVDTPTLFGLSAAQHAADIDVETLVYLTAATANLPTSGRLSVDIIYSLFA
jgi:hypothetical protein